MASIHRFAIAFLSAALLAAGCFGDTGPPEGDDSGAADDTDAATDEVGPADTATGGDTASTDDTGPGGDTPDTTAADGPTYHRDVKPIVDGRCVRCHTEGGIAPFPLTTYEEVDALKTAVKEAVVNEIMPPYMADNTCTDYKHDTSLTDEQIQTVVEWVDGGAPEGDPGDSGDPLPEVAAGLSRVDTTLEMPDAYEPRKEPDDYRCFPIEWPADETRYVTGFGIEPGREELVHHVIAYLADPSLSDEVDGKVASEEGPGYTCFGGPGVGTSGSASSSTEWLAAGAPGGEGMDFPQGTGIEVEPGSQIILQVHYNTLTEDPAPDRTKVLTRVAEEVDKEAEFIPFTNPEWLRNEESMLIPAGSEGVTHSFSYDVASFLGRPIRIYDVFFHMHQLGTRGRMWIDRSGDDGDCLVDIPRWDFNWQRGYRLERPRTLEAGDELAIECQWDNSPSNQPVIDGERQSPTDVTWGEGTQDEMCLGVLYATFE